MNSPIDLFRRNLLARALKLPPARDDVSIQHDVAIPMEDGITLLADHYAPKTKEACPTVLIRCPWGHDWSSAPFSIIYMFIAQRFAERGYHVVLQDTRPSSNPPDHGWLINEARDGKATLDWIGRQQWFNGALGMWGPSILGYMQWAAAVDAPPFLQAIVPVTTASQWYTMIFPDGAFALDTVLRLAMTVGAAGKPMRDLLSGGRKQDQALKSAFLHLPIVHADVVALGESDPVYQYWFTQTHRDDPFWQATAQSDRVPQITAKAHLIAGWYDIFLRGQLEDYAALRRAGRSPHLTIGPWHHTSPDLAFDSVRQALKWFDANLRGNSQGLEQQPVRVFVLGAKEWREFADWPPLSQEIRYSLYSRGQLIAQPPAADSPPDYYRYDPSDPTPSIGGPLLDTKSAGQQDNRALEARRDVLCYTTPELEADVEIIGSPRLQLYAQSSAAHSDFFARLCDVHPDGSSLNVCDGLVRTKSESDRPQSAASRCIEIEMHSIGYRFLRRHRIRLQVSSGAHPRWSRNLGTDEPFATATRMITVDQTIYHDITHPSALILPVM